MAIEWNERHIFGIGVPRERWCAAFICGIYLRHLFAAFSSGISQPHFSAGGATLIRAATRVARQSDIPQAGPFQSGKDSIRRAR
jgi:hypothetical protein